MKKKILPSSVFMRIFIYYFSTFGVAWVVVMHEWPFDETLIGLAVFYAVLSVIMGLITNEYGVKKYK